jgi:hypothetical protein
MLYLAAAERRRVRDRMDAVMDAAAAHAGGKSANEWITTLDRTRSKV